MPSWRQHPPLSTISLHSGLRGGGWGRGGVGEGHSGLGIALPWLAICCREGQQTAARLPPPASAGSWGPCCARVQTPTHAAAHWPSVAVVLPDSDG